MLILCKRLHKAIMAKKSTIEDIARELNITPSTVSRALNGNSRISAATREAVAEVSRRLNYQPNQIAAALRSGRSYTVGVMVPTADRSFFAKVVRGIEETVQKAGFNVIICQSNDRYEQEKQNIAALLRLRADGIIASIAKETTDYQHFAELAEKGLAVVLFDRVGHDLPVHQVVLDDFQAAHQAVTHLIQQGARRIAHFGGLQHINIYRDRLQGYQQALRDHGLTVDPSWQVFSKNLLLEDGIAGMQQLLQLPNPPDAVFSASDYAALGAMQVLKSRGFRIPEDCALVGFANEPFTAYLEPALTTIDQHSVLMGATAAQLFLRQIEQRATESVPQRISLPGELLLRASSRRKT